MSAQSNVFLTHLDGSRGHPIVSGASHVCLPTDLAAEVYDGNYSAEHRKELLQRYAMGIPDMFPAMRRLHMTRPNESIRCGKYDNRKYNHCFGWTEQNEPRYGDMRLFNVSGLSRHWQHVNLRELLIEGFSLGITIPALPCLEMLVVFCEKNVALDFIDPKSLGRAIRKMSVVQHEELCTALAVRDLNLVGDWSRCIAIHLSNSSVPTAVELREQAQQEFACKCKACPSCLGIGTTVYEELDHCSRA